MEASSSTRKKSGGGLGGAMFSTRRGSIMTAIISAAIAGVLILVFVNNNNKPAAPTVTNTPVVVASGFIPKGTPANLVASSNLIARTTVPSTHALPGAITDTSTLHGEVAVTDIYPGQQLTAADFSATATELASQLTGPQRAIAFAIDSAHGLTPFLQAGDHVDVYADFGHGAMTLLLSDVFVLSAPGGGTSTSNGISSSGSTGTGGGGSGSGGNVVVRVTPQQAATLGAAVDSAKIYLTLRPLVTTGTLGANATGTK